MSEAKICVCLLEEVEAGMKAWYDSISAPGYHSAAHPKCCEDDMEVDQPFARKRC